MDPELRWSDCDAMAASDPIGTLLCRTSKLNDGHHYLVGKLAAIEVEFHATRKQVDGVAAAVAHDGHHTRRYGLAAGALVTLVGVGAQAFLRHLGWL